MLANYGYTDITPGTPLPLAGFSARTGHFTGIDDPLEANVLILKQNNNRVVIVSTDLLYVGTHLRQDIIKVLGGLIEDKELFISATHSHFAPATDDRKPGMGSVSNEYLKFVVGRITNLILALLKGDFIPVQLTFSLGNCDNCVNRRKYCWQRAHPLPRKKMLMLPNFKAPRDKQLRMVQVQDIKGKLRALIWNYSCHPVCFPQIDKVSSDYPGAVRFRLRSKYGPAFPVIFLQGFAGNIRPRAFARDLDGEPLLNQWFKKIIYGKRFGPFSDVGWNGWITDMFNALEDTLECNGNPLDGPMEIKRLSLPLNKLGFESPDPVSFHSITIDNLKIIGVSAEPVVEYIPILNSIFGGFHILPVGYIDQAFGYLPTREMLVQGGYEVDGFKEWFGLKGSFQPGFQEEIINILRKL